MPNRIEGGEERKSEDEAKMSVGQPEEKGGRWEKREGSRSKKKEKEEKKKKKLR